MLPAAVIKRGDSDAGGVLLKINRMGSGCEVHARMLDGNGETVWMVVAGGVAKNNQQQIDAELKCDEYIKRELNIDPDLWVIEIEDGKGVYVPVM